MLRKRKSPPQRRGIDKFELTDTLNEKLLFHGTSADVIESIYTQNGFDWRYSGKSVKVKLVFSIQ